MGAIKFVSRSDFKNGVGLVDGDVVNIGIETSFEQQTYFKPVITRITKVTLGAFRSRLTLAEKVGIVDASMGDSEVLVIEADLNHSAYIDVDNVELQWGLALLANKGLLTQERLPDILKDGESHEAF